MVQDSNALSAWSRNVVTTAQASYRNDGGDVNQIRQLKKALRFPFERDVLGIGGMRSVGDLVSCCISGWAR
jgi:hypothetical protein